jgi:hypothetical protein
MKLAGNFRGNILEIKMVAYEQFKKENFLKYSQSTKKEMLQKILNNGNA